MSEYVDVVVTDGFTGNVVLKTLEGGLKRFVGAVLEALDSTEEVRAVSPAVLRALAPLADEFDADTYGGAMLLGVTGCASSATVRPRRRPSSTPSGWPVTPSRAASWRSSSASVASGRAG